MYTVDLLTEVCPNVCLEPHLQSLSGEQLTTCMASTEDGVHLNVAANGFWEVTLNVHSSM